MVRRRVGRHIRQLSGRHLTFPTLYGLKAYWFFGVVLALSVIPLVAFGAPVASGAFTGALIEYIFGALLFTQKHT